MKLSRQLNATERKKLGEPCLRLFASIDLEGSTAFKQTLANQRSRVWLDVVLDFVETFERDYWQHIGTQAREAKTTSPKQPRLWKILGDELVFVMEITRSIDATIYVDALAAALADWNRQVLILRKSPSPNPAERPLLVKGAAWLAGFPVTNAVIPVAGGTHDYIGPSMDTGFRLAKLASPRRLALAVELAWLLLHRNPSRRVEFSGRTRDLKGVATDSGYPQLWIEVPASDYHAREHELLKKRRCDLLGEELRDLCDSFIRDFGVPPALPHIHQESSAYPPAPDYAGSLRKVQEKLATRYPLQPKKAEAKPTQKPDHHVVDELTAAVLAITQPEASASPPSDPKT